MSVYDINIAQLDESAFGFSYRCYPYASEIENMLGIIARSADV
jgi:hypothetical protein